MWRQAVLAGVLVPLGDGRIVLTLAGLVVLFAGAVVWGVLALGARRKSPASVTPAGEPEPVDETDGVAPGW